MTPSDRLDSWKEIAAYLKRDVRTVQRWEAFESLPVHRHQHKKRGSVYALRGELDTWRDTRRAEFFEPAPAAPAAGAPIAPAAETRISRLGPWSWIAVLSVAVTFAGVVSFRRDRGVTTSSVEHDAVRLFGEALRDGGAVRRIAIPSLGHDLALGAGDRTLFVSYCDGPVSGIQAIDVATQQVEWTIEGLKTCARMLLSPDRKQLYFAEGAQLGIADVDTRAIRRIDTRASKLFEIAISPDGRRMFAAASFDGVLEIDTQSGAVTQISKLPCPVHVAVSPSGDRLYVSYQCGGPGGARGHDSIDVIDTRTRASIAVIKGLPNVGGGLVVSADGSQLWAEGSDACRQPVYDHVGCPPGTGGIINVIRTSDFMLVRSLRVGSDQEFNMRLSATPDGKRVIAGRDQTTTLNTATLGAVESAPMLLMSNIVFSRDGSSAFAIIGDPKTVAMLPLANRPPPPVGLTGRWTFDGLATDSAAGNDFESLPSSSFLAGRVGLAVRTDAAAPLRIAEATNLDIDSGFLTVAEWVKANTDAGQSMTVLEYGGPDGRGVRLELQADGRFAACVGFVNRSCTGGNSVPVVARTPSSRGQWHHVAVTRDGQDVALYVDGVAQRTARVMPAAALIGHGWLRIGSSEFDEVPFMGLVDEVEIYRRPLAAEEIQARMR